MQNAAAAQEWHTQSAFIPTFQTFTHFTINAQQENSEQWIGAVIEITNYDNLNYT